jgi:hypothetical protein
MALTCERRSVGETLLNEGSEGGDGC